MFVFVLSRHYGFHGRRHILAIWRRVLGMAASRHDGILAAEMLVNTGACFEVSKFYIV